MADVGWGGIHGHTVWRSGTADLVGVLMGYHGARHVFYHLWYSNSYVWLLRADTSGEQLQLFIPTLCPGRSEEFHKVPVNTQVPQEEDIRLTSLLLFSHTGIYLPRRQGQTVSAVLS